MIAYLFPGQGSQCKGMGADLFDEFSELIAQADDLLGYSIKELCLNDPDDQLMQTQYTQPALFIVSALSYLRNVAQTGTKPNFVAGHSLGEYSALFAAGALDFVTGVKLVQKRGALMSQATGGAMAAVVRTPEADLRELMIQHGLTDIDVANYNAPSQIVISGLKEDVEKAVEILKAAGKICIQLKVSGAFHSRYMQPAQKEFETFLKTVSFQDFSIPVIANVSARPYRPDTLLSNLSQQIVQSVQWVDTIRYLMGKGVTQFEELGPGDVLTKLMAKIQKEAEPLMVDDEPVISTTPESPIFDKAFTGGRFGITAQSLGNTAFKQAYGLKYAYVTGAMVRGIASTDMVVSMGNAGMMGYWGSGGMSLPEIENAIRDIQRRLDNGQPYGMNLLCQPAHPEQEERIVDLYLKYGVNRIEAAAYMQMTPALVKYRLKGLRKEADGTITAANQVMAKVSRPEVAEFFLSPAPERMVNKFLQAGSISQGEADMGRQVPMATALCVEADSGGHTDMGIMMVLLPTILRQRDGKMQQHGYDRPVWIGTGGGIGTPEAAAAAFMLGADFIVTGSINQCTIEAGTSDAVKDILAALNVQDTDYAPAADMFELGAKVQVVRKGVFFPARANKLYDLYRHYNSWNDIDEKTRKQIEEKYFHQSFSQVYAETREFFLATDPSELEKANRNPKHKMALVFRWYLAKTMQLALQGDMPRKVDFQIQCGPAMGAFNQWIRGTPLENWRQRGVAVIAEKLLRETAAFLDQRLSLFQRTET